MSDVRYRTLPSLRFQMPRALSHSLKRRPQRSRRAHAPAHAPACTGPPGPVPAAERPLRVGSLPSEGQPGPGPAAVTVANLNQGRRGACQCSLSRVRVPRAPTTSAAVPVTPAAPPGQRAARRATRLTRTSAGRRRRRAGPGPGPAGGPSGEPVLLAVLVPGGPLPGSFKFGDLFAAHFKLLPKP
jgi:hypothetical protein